MPRSSPQRRRTTHQARAATRQYERANATGSSARPDLGAMRATAAIPGIAILPLRLFLGITFIYAGWQKITDPGFFQVGSPTYIGAQLRGFAHGSPINFIMARFLEHAVPIGILTIMTEIAIGLAVLLGLFTRPAAIVGLILNLVFFLSASWHVYPYFLGPDIVFVMCWLTIAITGPGAFYLDAVAGPWLMRRFPWQFWPVVLGPIEPASPVPGTEPPDEQPLPLHPRRPRLLTRGEALVGGAATVVLLLLGLAPRGSLSSAAGTVAATKPSATVGPQPTAAAGGSTAGPPAGMKKVGTVSQVPANSALAFTDPKSGDPAVVVHTSGSDYFAFDAVCTHAGCIVQYDPTYKVLVCPCHGGAYDPAHGAAVVAGPPPTPLPSLPIQIDANGNIYVA